MMPDTLTAPATTDASDVPFRAFIEEQFPVSRLSKESFKERRAGASQTLTGLGKWWGRKPLILVRATLLGLLMPASGDPVRDREIFLKILTMDADGLRRRKNTRLPRLEIFARCGVFNCSYYFDEEGNWELDVTAKQKLELEMKVFDAMPYDDKLAYCLRPEQIDGPSVEAWAEINAYLGTDADTLQELVQELGARQFGHPPRVGDAFSGGGSIPFEAARIGCEAYASDLNPAATLLTWAALHIVGGGPAVQEAVRTAQEEAFRKTDEQITAWGVEHNEEGWRADAYLYCVDAVCPATGYRVPLAPSWVISEKQNVCAVLRALHEEKRYEIEVITGATGTQMAEAKRGTVQDGQLICPETGQRFAIAALRGDTRVHGKSKYGLRLWEGDDVAPRPDDVFGERLYCIRYIETFYERRGKGARVYSKIEAEALPDFAQLLGNGTLRKKELRHYKAPDNYDLKREAFVLELLLERMSLWQERGLFPSTPIPRDGVETDRLFRERGWTYWHHLFNPRQLLVLGQYIASIDFEAAEDEWMMTAISSAIASATDFSCRLARWTPQGEKVNTSFSNQTFNTLLNYGNRGLTGLAGNLIFYSPEIEIVDSVKHVLPCDARAVDADCEFWITDPPYADAVNYHELADFFLSWYCPTLTKFFPDWYCESKSALAVKGRGQDFNQSMVDCYRNLTAHMPANGAQVVMFTHQDAGVWADLALILWAAGLQVTAAWTIQTETDAVGIKTGNYVQGTVCMVLRKQRSEEVAFLSDIQSDVEVEVKRELAEMMALDDKDQPNFSDTDYQLAAYVAALRVITGYRQIQDIDVRYELTRARKPGEVSEVQKIIDSAVAVACEYLVPQGFDPAVWRGLSGDERFYLKGLEIQSHGEYRSGVFSELARGFGMRDYKPFLKSGKANETRLMTATEFGTRQLDAAIGWDRSLVRQVLFAIRETVRDDSPRAGRAWLKDELPDYWGARQRVLKILDHVVRVCAYIPEWSADVEGAKLLAGFVQNDAV